MPLPLITAAPAAFTPQAQVINHIARAVNAALGKKGIKVTVTATQIIFDLAPTLDVSITGTAAYANTATSANTATYATSAGTAAEATHASNADSATSANTAAYATTAGSVDAANLTGTTLAAGVTHSSLTQVGTLSDLNVSGDVFVGYLASNTSIVAANVQMYGSGGKTIDLTNSGLTLNTGSKTATLAFASITEDMSIREIDVCSGNVAMKMLVLASAPY